MLYLFAVVIVPDDAAMSEIEVSFWAKGIEQMMRTVEAVTDSLADSLHTGFEATVTWCDDFDKVHETNYRTPSLHGAPRSA